LSSLAAKQSGSASRRTASRAAEDRRSTAAPTPTPTVGPAALSETNRRQPEPRWIS